MASLNKAIILGRLGQDPDIKKTNNSTVANLSIATSEKYKDKSGQMQEQTEWHRVTLWGRMAEIAEQYLAKGSLVLIEGKIQTRKWQDQSGADRYTTEIIGRELKMIGGKNDNQQSQSSYKQPDFSQPNDDDNDLPF